MGKPWGSGSIPAWVPPSITSLVISLPKAAKFAALGSEPHHEVWWSAGFAGVP